MGLYLWPMALHNAHPPRMCIPSPTHSVKGQKGMRGVERGGERRGGSLQSSPFLDLPLQYGELFS